MHAQYFTQSAYIRMAALLSDSVVEDSSSIALVKSKKGKERWYNAIARYVGDVHGFDSVRARVNSFDLDGINFNWHIWPGDMSGLATFLQHDIGMVAIGKADFLTKVIKPDPLFRLNDTISNLTEVNFEQYNKAKMEGWRIDASFILEIQHATSTLYDSKHHLTQVMHCNGELCGAVSSYIEKGYAYLRGDFIVPRYRGRGLYRRLILDREQILAKQDVHTCTVIADRETSSPIYQKLGYRMEGEILILARKKSSWVSL